MPAEPSSLIVVPCAGLCNRLQTVVCGLLLADDTARHFLLDWHADGSCQAAFEDLFEIEYPRPVALPPRLRCYSSVQRHAVSAPPPYAPFVAARPEERFTKLLHDPAPTIAIVSCHQFLGYFHDPRFGPRLRELFRHVRRELAAEADAFRRRSFGETTVGVHVRRTDWGTQPPVDEYLAAMRRFPGATFFVSSDDPASFPALRAREPRAVEYAKSSFSRGERRGIEQALIDVLLLSSTSYLIGTPGSSFSAVAREVGELPGSFDYGLSISMRDLRLGNLVPPARSPGLRGQLMRWRTLLAVLGRRLRRKRAA